MGKKGKKKASAGGSGKKKKGKGKKKGGGEPQMSWKEALFAYQINIKERQLEDVRYELRALQEKNERHLERNERLQQEQVFYMSNLLKQAKEFEQALDDQEPVEKNKVIGVMKDKWDAARQQDGEVAELKEQIALKEGEIVREQREVAYWLSYREKGSDSHAKQIVLLNQELDDMQSSATEMAGHLTRTLGQAKTEIEKQTEDRLDNQKYLATEKAMAKMDKNSRQEVLDNDWLRREVQIHKREADELLAQVEEIEKENLGIMSELFECTVEDLKISRNIFLTQFAEEGENLEDTGILELDLAKISLDVKEREFANRAIEAPKPARPKSATQAYIENKLMTLVVAKTTEEEEEEEEEADSDNESDYDGDNAAGESDEEDPFSSLFNFQSEDFDNYLQLGPLELKLLSVRGRNIAIHKPKTLSQEEIEAKQYCPDQWPLTKAAIRKATEPPRV